MRATGIRPLAVIASVLLLAACGGAAEEPSLSEASSAAV